MAHDDQFTAVGPSNTGAGFSRAAFSNNNQSGNAPQDFVAGVDVQGNEFGVYGECLPQGTAPPNAATNRKPPKLAGIAGRGSLIGAVGEGQIVGIGGTAIAEGDPNKTPNTVLVACLGGTQDQQGSNSAVLGVLGQGQFFGVVGASGRGMQSLPSNGGFDGVLGITGAPSFPGLHGAGVHGASLDPLGRGGVFESAGIAQMSLTPAPFGSKLPRVGALGDLFVRDEVPPTGAPLVDAIGLYLCIHATGLDPQQNPALWRKVQLSTSLFSGGT